QGGRNAYINQTSFLPLKLNMAGVIPAIFASSIIMFPATATTWFGQAGSAQWLQRVAQALSPGEPLYILLYAGLIAGFAFFYTALVFNSQETADNLKKSGALVPGIRPGKATAEYIDGVLTRLTAAGAAYLVLVCLLPEFMRTELNVSFYFGGTSLLIVVVVVMDFIAQIQAHLMSHQYESLLQKANLKGRPRPRCAPTDPDPAMEPPGGTGGAPPHGCARGRGRPLPAGVRRRSMGTLPMPGRKGAPWAASGFQRTRDPVTISCSLRRERPSRTTNQLEIRAWRVLQVSTCLPRSTSGSG